MFGEIDYSLPNPHGLPLSNLHSLFPSDSTQQSHSRSHLHWSHYPVGLSIMPSFTTNDSAFPNTNLSVNASLRSTDQSSSTEEPSDYLLYLIIPLYSLVFIIGTIGNILVILTVVTVKQMRNTTNALILHLAIANLSFVLMCIPHTIYVYTIDSYDFPRLLCKLANTLMYLSAYVSIYILVLMSVDRFLGVVFAVRSTKYRTERNAHFAVVVIWLLGIIFSSPNMIYYDVLPVASIPNVRVCLFREDNPVFNTTRHVTAYCFAVFGLIVPLIIIAILYGLIIQVLRQNSAGKQVAKGKKRVTKMVSAVISSFVICWTPMQINLIYTHHQQVNVPVAIISQSLVYISACVNPILYAFLSEPFRQAFRQFLTCSKLLSSQLLSSHDLASNAPRKSSTYRMIQQQSSTRNSSVPPVSSDLLAKRKSSNNQSYRMSDLNSEAMLTGETSEPLKHNRL